MAITLNMKTKSYLIGLLLLAAGLITLSSSRLTADSSPRLPHAAIIIGYTGTYGPPIVTENGGYTPQTGLVVTWVSCSRGCPTNLIGQQLGEAIAICMEAGFAVQHGQKGENLDQPEAGQRYLLTR